MSPKHKGSGFDSSGLCPANQKKGKTTTALEIVTAGATKKKPSVGMDIAAGFVIAFSIFFVIVNFVGVLAGSADYSRSYLGKSECEVRTKWSYVLPGYRFGCWMSEPLAVEKEEYSYLSLSVTEVCQDRGGFSGLVIFPSYTGRIHCNDDAVFNVEIHRLLVKKMETK